MYASCGYYPIFTYMYVRLNVRFSSILQRLSGALPPVPLSYILYIPYSTATAVHKSTRLVYCCCCCASSLTVSSSFGWAAMASIYIGNSIESSMQHGLSHRPKTKAILNSAAAAVVVRWVLQPALVSILLVRWYIRRSFVRSFPITCFAMVRYGFYHDPAAAAAVAAAALSVLLSVLLFSSLECACLSACLPTFACFSAIAAEAVSAVILCGIIERCRFCCWLIYASYLTLVGQLSPMCYAANVHSIPPSCQLHYSLFFLLEQRNRTSLRDIHPRRTLFRAASSVCNAHSRQLVPMSAAAAAVAAAAAAALLSFVRSLASSLLLLLLLAVVVRVGSKQSSAVYFHIGSAREEPACLPARQPGRLLAWFMTVGWSVGRSVVPSFVRSPARSLARSLSGRSALAGWAGIGSLARSIVRSLLARSTGRLAGRQAGSLV